jgi:monoterpene epsilon-lactone hydrolase
MSFRASLFCFLLRHLVKHQFDGIPDDVPAFRARMNGAARLAPRPPDEVSTEAVQLADVPGEWVQYGPEGHHVLLYLHGGGYVFGNFDSHRDIAWRLSKATGARVLLVDYRLAPEHPFPAALEDATACFRWLLDNEVPASSIALAGDSAGGGLAVATMVNLRNLGLALPNCAILLSPWADLSGSGESMQANARLDPMFSPAAVSAMATLYLGNRDRKAPLASPVFADLSGLPPMMVQVGSTEILLSDAERLVARAQAAGGQAILDVWPDMPHAFQIYGGRIPESLEAIERLSTFVMGHLDPAREAG